MTSRVLFLLLLLPLLASCAQKVDESVMQQARENLSPTVSNFSQVHFTPLANPSSLPASVTASDPVYDFGKGNVSYFTAFELPKTDDRYALRVKVEQVALGCYPCRGAYFMASILLLDEDKKPLPAKTQGPVYYGPNVTRYTWVDIPPDGSAKYAVIYTTQSALTHGDEDKGSGMVMPAGGMFVYIPAQTHHFDGVPIGSLTVETLPKGDPR